MSDQRDQQIPPIADTPRGDYLAPPRAPREPISCGQSFLRTLPIVLLYFTLFLNGLSLLILIALFLSPSSYYGPVRMVDIVVSGSLLIVQLFAIFKSRKWPTYALWLTLLGIVGSFMVFQR